MLVKLSVVAMWMDLMCVTSHVVIGCKLVFCRCYELCCRNSILKVFLEQELVTVSYRKEKGSIYSSIPKFLGWWKRLLADVDSSMLICQTMFC